MAKKKERLNINFQIRFTRFVKNRKQENEKDLFYLEFFTDQKRIKAKQRERSNIKLR